MLICSSVLYLPSSAGQSCQHTPLRTAANQKHVLHKMLCSVMFMRADEQGSACSPDAGTHDKLIATKAQLTCVLSLQRPGHVQHGLLQVCIAH